MTDKKYKVIVSDRAKRMLGAHIRFLDWRVVFAYAGSFDSTPSCRK